MTRAKKYFVVALLASVVIAISACSMMIRPNRTESPAGGEERGGPPPNAPARGYQHEQSGGIQLVFDSNIGVYVVSGYTEHYYYHNRYYRWNNGSWQTSTKINRGWGSAPERTIPPGLRKSHGHEKGR
jgi:hypothetical protein